MYGVCVTISDFQSVHYVTVSQVSKLTLKTFPQRQLPGDRGSRRGDKRFYCIIGTHHVCLQLENVTVHIVYNSASTS